MFQMIFEKPKIKLANVDIICLKYHKIEVTFVEQLINNFLMSVQIKKEIFFVVFFIYIISVGVFLGFISSCTL